MFRKIELLPGESLTLRSGITIMVAQEANENRPRRITAVAGQALPRASLTLLDYVEQRHGLQSALAEAVGCPAPSIWHWARGERQIPAHYAPMLEHATEGSVLVEAMRPDLPWLRVPDVAWPTGLGRPVIDYFAQGEA